MRVNVVPHTSDEPVMWEEKLYEYFKDGDLSRSIVCSDWDGTMVEQDTGIQVFIQKLLDPHYWPLEDRGKFMDVVLPDEYYIIFSKGAEGNGDHELDQEKCKYIMGLAWDIVNLHAAITDRVVSGDFEQTHDIHEFINDPMINEFARKMIELDRIAMEMDKYLSNKLDGKFLLRTRFARNKKIRSIREVARRVWNYKGQTVKLSIHEKDPLGKNNRRVGRDHPLVQNPDIEYPLCPTVDQRILSIQSKLISVEDPALIRVITTNHPAIVDAILRETPYEDVIGPTVKRNRIESDDPMVRGTRLKVDKEHGMVLEMVSKDLPRIAAEKRVLSGQVADMHDRYPRIALGDTSGDLEMGLQALRGTFRGKIQGYLEGNGLFFVVPKGGQVQKDPQQAIEDTRRKFHGYLMERWKNDEDHARRVIQAIGDRILYVVPMAG